MKTPFMYCREILEWLRNSKHPEPKPRSVPNPKPDPEPQLCSPDAETWFDDLINAEKKISKAVSRNMSATDYRDFAMSCIDDVMFNHGALPIEECGVPYDPLYHRPSAVMEVADGEVVSEVVMPGVILNGRVLRRAKVNFSKEV